MSEPTSIETARVRGDYGNHFQLPRYHVLPVLIRRFYWAKESGVSTMTASRTGSRCREFLHVDDLADACLHLMDYYDDAEIVNVGVGDDISIGELATLIREVVGFRGEIDYDTTKPDGTPRKLLDVSRLRGLGWQARIPLREGVAKTYTWRVANQGAARV